MGIALANNNAHGRQAALRQFRSQRAASALAVCTGGCITALVYAPALWLGVLSVSGDPLGGFPGDFTWRWYRALFAQAAWLAPLLLSVRIALLVAVLCMAGATLAGRVLPRMRRTRRVLLACFLLPLAIPGMVIGLNVFIFYRVFGGLRMGLWSLVLVHLVGAFPFALLGLMVVSLRFETSLLEAAADLGAGPWRRFWDIERPLLMPGIVTAGMFGFLLSFTELPRSLFVAGHLRTLPLYIWAEASSRTSHLPLIYCLNTMIAVVSTAISVTAVLALRARLRH
jgi:ABC-type spermidine/putrescine transport system permease subunit II